MLWDYSYRQFELLTVVRELRWQCFIANSVADYRIRLKLILRKNMLIGRVVKSTLNKVNSPVWVELVSQRSHQDIQCHQPRIGDYYKLRAAISVPTNLLIAIREPLQNRMILKVDPLIPLPSPIPLDPVQALQFGCRWAVPQWNKHELCGGDVQ